MRNKAIVLLSGGLDSAVTLYLARDNGLECFCLIFDYGQLHRKEIIRAKSIAQRTNCKWQIVKIGLPWKGSALLDRKIKLPISGYRLANTIPSTYVPARNIIFLSFALSFAEAVNAGSIYIGAHAQDYSGYPDCRPEFFKAFDRAAVCGTKAGVKKKPIKIKVPLINKTKAQIIQLGNNLGVPFELSWSCYRGGKTPCGRCDSCYFRAKGFIEAGLKDEGQNSRNF